MVTKVIDLDLNEVNDTISGLSMESGANEIVSHKSVGVKILKGNHIHKTIIWGENTEEFPSPFDKGDTTWVRMNGHYEDDDLSIDVVEILIRTLSKQGNLNSIKTDSEGRQLVLKLNNREGKSPQEINKRLKKHGFFKYKTPIDYACEWCVL